MTRQELAQHLREGGIAEADTEARLLFQALTGRSPADLLAEPALSCTDPRLPELLARRLRREPLQYLLGETDFYGETYRVAPGVLIPRLDTEVLVEQALALLPQGGRFADLCTGSGCIAISILAHRPDLTADAFDLSPQALALAEENRQRNGVASRLTLHRADLLQEELAGTYDAILSNPPYIPTQDLATLAPELSYEPSMALDGGTDGMLFYRTFLRRHCHALREGGFFLFEIGHDQQDAICREADAAGFSCRVTRDYGGNPRCAMLRRR